VFYLAKISNIASTAGFLVALRTWFLLMAGGGGGGGRRIREETGKAKTVNSTRRTP